MSSDSHTEKQTHQPPPLPESSESDKVVSHEKFRAWLTAHWRGGLLVLLGIAVVVVLYVALPKRKNKSKPAGPRAVNVVVQEIKPQAELQDTFEIPGVVEPNRIVNVAAECSARVDAYAGLKDRLESDFEIVHGPALAGFIDEGMTIRKGQPLMYLNTDLVTARLNQARAEADFQEREYERIKKAFERNVATQMEVDQVHMRRDTAQAVFEVARANMERSIVVSPIRGVLNRLPVEVGEYVSPGVEVAEIVDMYTVKVIVDVPERDIGFLELEHDQTIRYGLVEPKKVIGRITYISELADSAARTTRVEISVDNRKGILRSGQIVRVCIRRQVLPNVIMIPLQAVIPLEKGYVVYVEVNGMAKRRKVELDRNLLRDDQIRVLSGLKAGDKLIVKGNRFVGPDQPVICHPPAETQPAEKAKGK
jgi:membrane fusion protein (multidrug efflux system)